MHRSLTKLALAAAVTTAALFQAAGAAAAPFCAPGHACGTLYYTTFSGGANVHRVDYDYDPAAPSFSLSNNVSIGAVNGADGILFAPDGDLLIGGQGPFVHKFDIATATAVSAYTGGPAAFHLGLDPTGAYVWAAAIPGGLARVPLAPFGPAGIPWPLVGDDSVVDSIIFDPAGTAYYTSSGAGGFGWFGRVALGAGPPSATMRLAFLPAAHGAAYDSFSGNILLFGDSHVTQLDGAAAIQSDLDLTGQGFTFDQGAVDGQGHAFVASNDGRLLFIDYSASGLVAAPGNFRQALFLRGSLDDIAPLSGLGAPADITVDKAGPATVAEGDSITYTVTVTNHGPANATSVVVTDTLPAGTVYSSASPGCAEAGGVVTCTIAAIPNGGSASVLITVVVPPGTAGPLTNSAEARATEFDTNPGDNGDSVSTVVLRRQADLSLEKDGPTLVNEGGSIAYSLLVSNAGPGDASNVVVTDTLPAGTSFASASTGCSSSAGIVTCAVGGLAAGSSITLHITVEVPAGASGTLVNSAAVHGDETDPNPANNADTASTEVNRLPSCADVTAGPALWPPNHKLVPVTLTGAADADGDAVTLTITGVTQDEPLNGLGDGDTGPTDAGPGAASNTVLLRAERSGKGDGRVYRIAYTAADGRGGVCSGTISVGVPHSQNGAPAVDSGAVFVDF